MKLAYLKVTLLLVPYLVATLLMSPTLRGHTVAHKAAKAARAVTHKAAGLATQKSKTPDQVKNDRKIRKDQQAVNKATKIDKAKAKDNFKSHEQKIKDKAKVTFSPGASRRLDGMDLHGKDRQAVKKFHKNIMTNEMKMNGAVKGIVVYVLLNLSTLLPLVHASLFTVLPLTQGGASKRRRTTSRHSSLTPKAGPYRAPGKIARPAISRLARRTNITFMSTTKRKRHPLGRRLLMRRIVGRRQMRRQRRPSWKRRLQTKQQQRKRLVSRRRIVSRLRKRRPRGKPRRRRKAAGKKKPVGNY